MSECDEISSVEDWRAVILGQNMEKDASVDFTFECDPQALAFAADELSAMLGSEYAVTQTGLSVTVTKL